MYLLPFTVVGKELTQTEFTNLQHIQQYCQEHHPSKTDLANLQNEDKEFNAEVKKHFQQKKDNAAGKVPPKGDKPKINQKMVLTRCCRDINAHLKYDPEETKATLQKKLKKLATDHAEQFKKHLNAKDTAKMQGSETKVNKKSGFDMDLKKNDISNSRLTCRCISIISEEIAIILFYKCNSGKGKPANEMEAPHGPPVLLACKPVKCHDKNKCNAEDKDIHSAMNEMHNAKTKLKEKLRGKGKASN
jgi:hypothetical protein